MDIPIKLGNFAAQMDANNWLEALPRIVQFLCRKWDLELGETYPDSGVSYVAQVRRFGVPLVLKIQWPHEECRYESDALRLWAGRGAVRLIETDTQHHALLLERCNPGTHLSRSDESDPIGVMVKLLPKLWISAADPFKTLRGEASNWRSRLYENWEKMGKPCEKKLIDTASGLISELSDDQGEQVLLHQDLHGENVLQSDRDAWLAIDPKPLMGEREFGLAPVIRSFEFGRRQRDVLYRRDRLTSELSLNPKRAAGWTLVQSVAWAWGSAHAEQHFTTARWLRDVI